MSGAGASLPTATRTKGARKGGVERRGNRHRGILDTVVATPLLGVGVFGRVKPARKRLTTMRKLLFSVALAEFVEGEEFGPPQLDLKALVVDHGPRAGLFFAMEHGAGDVGVFEQHL